MAQINVCDRCRKELTYRRTLVGVKPRGKYIDVSVFRFDPFGTNDAAGKHSFELCDNCANELGRFLNYGPREVSSEEKGEGGLNGEG